MKRSRYVLPVALAIFVVTLAARPCGPDFPTAVFVLQTGPGGSYASYAAGHLGVPQSGYRTRHLVVAYDYLNGHPLPVEVQHQAVATNDFLLNPWHADDTKANPGYDHWLKARAAFGPVDGYLPDGSLSTSRNVPGESYNSFENCLDDAFTTAAGTLTDRIASHTAKDPAVVDWVRAQDSVFTNCGDPSAYFGPPNKQPAPPPAARMPKAAPASASPWLQQDRAYQLAAASFYALQYGDAVTRFRAIAADNRSPWSKTAHYLVARSYLRSATMGSKEDFVKAQQALVAMHSDPAMASMRPAIDSLLDFVNIRLEPRAQAAVLAARLQSPDPATYRQAVIDLTWLHSTHGDDDGPDPALSSPGQSNDMLAWIDAVTRSDEASAVKHWRSTHSVRWLVPAISYAKAGDAAAADLIQAAKAVAPTDPGWSAVTYHRLRLTPQDAATRGEIVSLFPQIKRSGDPSTINLFLTLLTTGAPSLDDWLTTVARVPAGQNYSDGGEESLPANISASTDDAVRGAPAATVEGACGEKLPARTVLALFDADAAVIFNHDMPLHLLAQAAESNTLPANLRYQVAQAAWTRAVLLEKPEVARRMTPILTACRPAWTPVLSAYDTAASPDARHVTGLLALMRFASTVPSVWEGEDRRAGFATYDEFRENWWCSTIPKPGETVDVDLDALPDPPASTSGSAPTEPKLQPPVPPPFLSQADLKEARAEGTTLERIPRASTYFAQQALAWQRQHPTDPQAPELLGEADRVVRNACRKDPPYETNGPAHLNPADMTFTSNLARTLFETLHRSYPDSAWAKRYTSWE